MNEIKNLEGLGLVLSSPLYLLGCKCQVNGWPIITLPDGLDLVKFPPTFSKPITFRAKLGECPH